MCHRFLCGLVVVGWSAGLSAQSVPARDLWEFPLGAVLEPAAFASEPGGGLWNPAAGHLGREQRWRLGVASLATAAQQSVAGQLLSADVRRDGGMTLGVSIAKVSVADILRTDSDPQGLGQVLYSSLLLSVTASRQLLPHVTVGVSARYREGRADRQVGSAVAADVGLIVDALPVLDARVAVSSFLWRPGRELDDRPALLAAADVRLMGERGRETRVGYSVNDVSRGARERGPFVAWRFDRLNLRGSYLRTSVSGRAVSRIRSGLALHYARYVVGVAREEGASGLGPSYQFTLSAFSR